MQFNQLDDIGNDFLKHLQQMGPAQDPNQPNLPPGVQSASDASTSESPRDRAGSAGPGMGGNPDNPYQPNPVAPPSLTPPSPEAYNMPGQGMSKPSDISNPASTTPPQGMAPNPVSQGQEQPFQPLPKPTPESLVKPLGSGSMLGSAGGLMGGGLGAADLGSGGDMSSLLPMLLQLLGQ